MKKKVEHKFKRWRKFLEKSVTAYDILKELNTDDPIDEIKFYQLIRDFQKRFLKDQQYDEKILHHRNASEIRNGFLSNLYKYDLEIQNRNEMREYDPATKTSGHVPTAIKRIWMEDKRLRSLYNCVKRYCQIRNKGFNTIAIHIAEHRALNKLSAKIRRDISKGNKPEQLRHYTCDDWLENEFCDEKNYAGDYVANDSERYLDLVSKKKMSYEELNKIQDAQQRAYDYMIECSLKLNERQFQRQTKETLDLQRVLENKIEDIGKYFRENQTMYNSVILPKLHRGIKYGAKFLIPEQYTDSLNRKISDVYTPVFSKYQLNINGRLTSFPTPDQMKYAMMEVQIRWLKILQGYKSKIKFDEMITSKDFKMLIDNYGEGSLLLENYTKGLDFAPDRDLFISNRVKTFESVLSKYQSSIGAWDRQNKREIMIQTGEYKRIGFAWVNNGHNAQESDLTTITLNNITLCPEVPPEGRYAIYVNVLHQLAAGGAMAFHLAFLREQLKKQTTTIKPLLKKFWLGSEEQKLKLFEELATESFISNTSENRTKFMNNAVVQWNQHGRSLFYMLDQLKQKKYNMIERFENLGPVIRHNFVDKNRLPFKNVLQNMSGMNNSTKNGKPRLADKIDDILKASLLS